MQISKDIIASCETEIQRIANDPEYIGTLIRIDKYREVEDFNKRLAEWDKFDGKSNSFRFLKHI